jgi:hypothetical protein
LPLTSNQAHVLEQIELVVVWEETIPLTVHTPPWPALEPGLLDERSMVGP